MLQVAVCATPDPADAEGTGEGEAAASCPQALTVCGKNGRAAGNHNDT